jgi:hypothetical protein
MAGGFLFKITSVPTPTSLTYDIPTTGLTNGNNGFVSRDPQGLIQVKAPPWLTENGPGYRLCPEVVGNGTSCAVGATCNRNPTCLPGERSQRPQTEIHVLKSFKEAGQDGCPPSPPLPTGSRCWELNSPISFNNWNQDRKPGAYFHNAGRGGHSNYVGFEDFSVDATNDGITVPNAGHVGIVQLTGCVNCWVKNLRLIRSARASVWIRNFSSQITVADNYAYYTKSPTSTSYMYETNGGVNDSLFVNNICQSGSVCMIQQTANSNVFAYNYGIAANNGNPVAHCTPMAIINHESGFWSLFEGNVTTSGSLDNVHGPGGAITMFRSRMRGNDWPAKWTSCYGFRTQMTNRVNNIIGSLVGGFGEVTGAEQMVSYEGTQNTGALFEFGFWPGDWLGFRDGLARTSSMRWGNWDSVNRAARWEPSEVPTNSTAVGFNNNPVPANQDLPPSFYVPTRPAFFTTGWGTPGWPPIGPDVNAAAGSGGGDPALDATCTGRDGSNNRIVDGPGSPFACTGAAHMAYQIPAQICFIRSAIDPEYEQTYHVTGGHWVRNYASAGQSNIPIVQLDVVNDINSRIGFPTGDCSTGAGPTSACQNATVVTIKGVVPDAYNGVVQLLRTQSTVIAYQPANPVGGGNWSATNPGPVTNTTGVVTWPNIRLFNGRQCYPQDFPAPSAQTRRH